MRLAGLGLPGATFRGSSPSLLRFEFDAVPFLGARDYRCRIELRRESLGVDTFVLRPDLQALALDKKLPHIYGDGKGITELCLYTPASGEWYRGRWLSETTIPWTYEWLRYFELWLVDGEWYGGGTHPTNSVRRRYGTNRQRQ